MKGTLKGCKMTNYHDPMFIRLEPRTPFKGGRITETDVLNLTEAAKFASVHAGAEITPADFLRAAGRGEITLRAIVHQTAKLQRIGGGVYCNAGQPNENTVPNRSILNLPLSACSQLAATGRASWRTFDGFETVNGILMRYTIAELLPDEPDFETVTDDCRVTGNAVNALADAYIDEPAPATDTVTPAPVVADSDAKPWLQADPRDPAPDQHWYTPARYFARQLVVSDSTLLIKKTVLADKVSKSLASAGIYKRGGAKPHDAATVLKAFVKVQLG